MQEKTIKKRFVFKGNAVNFRNDTVRLVNGRIAGREFMEHPGAVGILPVMPDDTVWLIRQYRYPVKEITYEIPAGKLSKGENPLSCIKRELSEEAGLKAKKIKKIGSFWPTCAFSNEVIHLYIARHLFASDGKPDYDEFLERVKVPFKKALKWIKTGRVKDSKTIIALLLYAKQKL